MKRLRLIEWNPVEAKKMASFLDAAGFSVEYKFDNPSQLLRDLRNHPPDAILIDLSRLPSQGRDIGLLLRQGKSTRLIPLIFLNGEGEKLGRVKQLLPDASFATRTNLLQSLKRAIANPPVQPVEVKSVFDAYAGTPLVKKLGIKPDSTLMLRHAPPGFEKKLKGLPPGVTVRRNGKTRSDLTLWFNRSRAEYLSTIKKMASSLGEGRLWVVWPKLGGKLAGDLTEKIVRTYGLESGLVDFKICSIDETWSALLFTRRKSGKVK